MMLLLSPLTLVLGIFDGASLMALTGCFFVIGLVGFCYAVPEHFLQLQCSK